MQRAHFLERPVAAHRPARVSVRRHCIAPRTGRFTRRPPRRIRRSLRSWRSIGMPCRTVNQAAFARFTARPSPCCMGFFRPPAVLCLDPGQRPALDLCRDCEEDFPRNLPACRGLRDADAGSVRALRRLRRPACRLRCRFRAVPLRVPAGRADPSAQVRRRDRDRAHPRHRARTAACRARPSVAWMRSCRCRSTRRARRAAATTRRARSRVFAAADVAPAGHDAARARVRATRRSRRQLPAAVRRLNVKGAFERSRAAAAAARRDRGRRADDRRDRGSRSAPGRCRRARSAGACEELLGRCAR